MTEQVLTETQLDGIPSTSQGKVRDLYDADGHLIIVTSDRISAFDVVLGTSIPDKGRVLNQLSLYWYEKSSDLIPNHLVTANVDEYPERFRPFASQLRHRSMLVRKLEPVPFECVVRGYLYGSGYKEYQRDGSVCGVELPKGMKLAEPLERPLFTPSVKATSGHDTNVSESVMASALGSKLTERLKDVSLKLYELGRERAAEVDILIADTKFEFGRDPDTGELFLIDEVLTPDSSRFWPRESYEAGHEQPSFDKQFVREYLETLSDWDKTPPGPELPESVVSGTRERYLRAYRSLTGKSDL